MIINTNIRKSLKCFSHGQLYIAMSRVGHLIRLRMMIKSTSENSCFAENVVYSKLSELD